MKEQKFRKFPELIPGLRIQYIDRDDKTRVGRIHSRTGNIITVINSLTEKTRIKLDRIIGYWKPKVKAKYNNMIQLQVVPIVIDPNKQLRNDCRKQKRKEGLRQTILLRCNECDAKECVL